MYDNIGGKIKGLAKWIFIVEIFAAIIGGIVLIASAESVVAIPIALLVILGGIGAAYVCSVLLYGFGELIDKAFEIERNTRGGGIKSEKRANEDDERIKKIEKLRSQGLITEEEYKQAISKKSMG